MSYISNTPNGTNSKLDIAEERIAEHEHIIIETIQNETKKNTEPKKKEKGAAHQECRKILKQPNTWAMRFPSSEYGRGHRKNFEK